MHLSKWDAAKGGLESKSYSAVAWERLKKICNVHLSTCTCLNGTNVAKVRETQTGKPLIERQKCEKSDGILHIGAK